MDRELPFKKILLESEGWICTLAKINHSERPLQQGMGSQANYRNLYNICSFIILFGLI
jgi:hypothetical protein